MCLSPLVKSHIVAMSELTQRGGETVLVMLHDAPQRVLRVLGTNISTETGAFRSNLERDCDPSGPHEMANRDVVGLAVPQGS